MLQLQPNSGIKGNVPGGRSNFSGLGNPDAADGKYLPVRKRLEAMDTKKVYVPTGYRLIFRAWYTDKNGNRVYAKDHGLKGWPLLVRIGK